SSRGEDRCEKTGIARVASLRVEEPELSADRVGKERVGARRGGDDPFVHPGEDQGRGIVESELEPPERLDGVLGWRAGNRAFARASEDEARRLREADSRSFAIDLLDLRDGRVKLAQRVEEPFLGEPPRVERMPIVDREE